MRRALAVITAILVSIIWLGMIVGVPALAATGQLERWLPMDQIEQLIDQTGVDAATLTGVLPAELQGLLPPTPVEEEPEIVVADTATPTPEPPTPTPDLPTETPTPEVTPTPEESPTPELEIDLSDAEPITDTGEITTTVDITTTTELTSTQELTPTVDLEVTTAQTTTVASIANLRSGPGTDFDIVGTVDAGAVITIIARDESGEWFQLEDETWIFGVLLTQIPEAPVLGAEGEDAVAAATPAPTEDDAPSTETPALAEGQFITTTVSADSNLRAGPGTTYNVTAGVTAGTVVTLAARNLVGTWYLIETGSWVSATLLNNTPEDLPIVNEQGIIVTGPNAGQSVLPQTPTEEETETEPAAEEPPPAVQATTNVDANLRSGPGTTFDVVGSAPPGATLDLVGRNAAGDWFRLADGSWIFAQLVNNPPANLPVVTTP